MAQPHWKATLADVERSIHDCLSTLDRYEAAFARVLAEGGPPPAPAPELSPVWNQKLAEAEQATDDVERLLAEQDGIWHRWKETLAEWHGLIEQPA